MGTIRQEIIMNNIVNISVARDKREAQRKLRYNNPFAVYIGMQFLFFGVGSILIGYSLLYFSGPYRQPWGNNGVSQL